MGKQGKGTGIKFHIFTLLYKYKFGPGWVYVIGGGTEGNCPYKRKKGGVCEVSIPNARRDEGARLGRG